jgi:hypothetical protein
VNERYLTRAFKDARDQIDRLEPAEFTPLRYRLPWDFEWNPPPGWCRVS